MRLPLPLLCFLSALLWAPLARAQGEVNAPDAGFSIEVDVEGWAHAEQKVDGRLTALGIGPAALGGAAQITIQVTPSPESGLALSQSTLDQLLALVDADASISLGERFEYSIGGATAAGINLDQEAQGTEYRVKLMFLHANGFQYRVQFHSPKDNFDELWPSAEKVLATFALIKPDDEARQEQTLTALAARCGSQIDWAANWEDAAKRGKSEGKLIVVAVHSIPGFDLGSPLMQGPFMDPEVVTLMQHRFIGYEWSRGESAPFVSDEVFGLGPATFGTGLLVVTPQGQVVRQIYLVDGMLTAAALRETLAGHPQLQAPAAPSTLSRAEQVAFAIDHGDLAQAKELAGPPPGSGAQAPASEAAALAFQRARLAYIECQGALGLHALDHAQATDEVELQATMALMRSTLHMGMNQLEESRAALEAFPAEGAPANWQAFHELQLATLHWAHGERDAAKQTLESLCEALPDQPGAWAAAAALIGPGLQMDVTPDLSFPDEYAFEAARIGPAAPAVDVLDMEAALPEALAWLLDHQQEDGSWRTPAAIGDTQVAADPITMATQAIALRAMLGSIPVVAESEPAQAEQLRQAVLRGLSNFLAKRQVVRENPRTVAFMDYTCWGSSYGLFLLADVYKHFEAGHINPGRHTLGRVREEMEGFADDLVRIQQANGGWSYYLSGQVGGEATVAAMSFTTATVLNALVLAEQHGYELDPSVLNRGRQILMVMRGTNEAFEYLRMGGGLDPAGEVEVLGGAARGPLCAHTLVVGEMLEAEDMALPFERYVEHLHTYGHQSRRALMHCGAQTQGSHYLTYDYSTAAEALAAFDDDRLPAELRAQVREETLRQLARCRSADGSFIDNPIIGQAAGTGLAIQAMLALR